MISVKTPEELSIVLREKFPGIEVALWPDEMGLPPLVSVLCQGIVSEKKIKNYIEQELTFPLEIEVEIIE